MALKKEEKTLTAAEQEEKRVAEAKALEEQKEKDAEEARLRQEEADKVEKQRLADEQAEKDAAAEREGEEARAKEEKRLADKKVQDDKDAESERLRNAESDEVAKIAGRQPRELKLVLVESLIIPDLRQPSTGKWIPGKGQAHLLHDGWLNNQIKSRLLKIVDEE